MIQQIASENRTWGSERIRGAPATGNSGREAHDSREQSQDLAIPSLVMAVSGPGSLERRVTFLNGIDIGKQLIYPPVRPPAWQNTDCCA